MTSTTDSTHSSSSRCPPVLVAGEIDIATAPRLRRALEHAAPDPSGRVVVDLSGVTFMDCSGLGPLLEAATRLGDRLSLRGVPPRVTALLHLAGLEARFGVAADAAVGRTGPSGRTPLPPEAGSSGVPAEPSHGSPVTSPPAGNASTGLLEFEEKVASQRAKVSGRARIDQAKGLLMVTHGCDAEQAWQMLFRASRAKGVQVHDLAEALAEAAAGRDMDQSSAAMRAAVLAVMAPDGETPDDLPGHEDRPMSARHVHPPSGREATEDS